MQVIKSLEDGAEVLRSDTTVAIIFTLLSDVQKSQTQWRVEFSGTYFLSHVRSISWFWPWDCNPILRCILLSWHTLLVNTIFELRVYVVVLPHCWLSYFYTHCYIWLPYAIPLPLSLGAQPILGMCLSCCLNVYGFEVEVLKKKKCCSLSLQNFFLSKQTLRTTFLFNSTSMLTTEWKAWCKLGITDREICNADLFL